MVQVYRVIAAFEAKQLDREPLLLESFLPGDLLIALTSEDSYTTFCRHDDSMDLAQCDRFIMGDWEFVRSTEPYGGSV